MRKFLWGLMALAELGGGATDVSQATSGSVRPQNKLEKAEEVSSEEAERFVTEVERYLNGIKTLSARLTQTTLFKSGKQQTFEGQCWLDKTSRSKRGELPCRIRIDIPSWRFLIREGLLYNCDLKRHKTSRNNVEATPLAPLFSNELNIRKQFKSYGLGLEKNLLSVTLKTHRDSVSGVTLFFALYPNGNVRCLSGWIIQDMAGNTTHVIFEEESVRGNLSLAPDLFELP